MKIAYLTSRYPYPLDRGDKLRAYHHIQELSRHHEVHLISLSEAEITVDQRSAMAEMCSSIDVHVLPEATRTWSAMRAAFSDIPFQVAYFYNDEIKRYIDLMLGEIAPDHIICQMVRMATYVIDQPMPKSIDYMDCLSANWAEHGPAAIKHLPYVRAKEQQRLMKYEKSIASRFDHRYIISERDRASMDISQDITIAPNGVDLDYFNTDKSQISAYQFVFCGNLGYIHNAKAAHYLIDEIVPKMQVDHRLLIAGARPPGWLNIKQSKQVSISGWTDDVRDHYRGGRVMIAPIFSGSGMQNKILEAMAMGIPCVTTPFVNEAIGATHGTHLYVADNPRNLLSYAEGLISREDEYLAMSLAARKFVVERYRWSEAVAPILDTIEAH